MGRVVEQCNEIVEIWWKWRTFGPNSLLSGAVSRCGLRCSQIHLWPVGIVVSNRMQIIEHARKIVLPWEENGRISC